MWWPSYRVSTVDNGADVAPQMQKQDDFTYREWIVNKDATESRLRSNIDLNWRFYLGDNQNARAPDFDDSDWRVLNLPHDWTIEGEYDKSNPSGPSCGYLPTGIAWYRKRLVIPDAWRNQRQVFLDFDGVFRNSQVYVNGSIVGERAYGWVSFAYDITRFTQQPGDIQIAVRVDNKLQPAARWYTGSGIYGHVYLLSTSPVHVDRYGTYVTSQVSQQSANVVVETVVNNDMWQYTWVSVRSTIIAPDQTTRVAQNVSPATIIGGGRQIVVSQSLTVPNPQLWTPDTPNVYRMQTEVLIGEQVVDDYSTPFGIRTISFSATDGLTLNGQNLKLRGVSDHWAAGALGAALPHNVMMERLQMLKKMGVNAVRTSHNPRPSYFYDACDQLGFVVMAEMFDGWFKKAAEDYGAHSFATDWKKDVIECIKRDRNHPSIFMWSIGNETGEEDTNGIVKVIESLDKTRGTTGGGVIRGVSIVGINGPSEYPAFKQPDKSLPFVATEAPHTWQVRGMYETQTWYRDGYTQDILKTENLTETEIFQYDWMKNPPGNRGFQSSYDNAYVRDNARYNWEMTRNTSWRMGEFRWTGFDYIGEAEYVSGGFPYRLFTSGTIDSANFEKDLYFLYQSMWAADPMLHILPSWTHPIMKEGTQIPIWVYSNCEVVELFQDGTSLGKVTRGPVKQREWNKVQFDWLVPWHPGTLTAVGYNAGGTQELVRETITSASAPAKLSVASVSGGNLPVDETFVDQIVVKTTDANGNFYPYGENRAYYYVEGPAYIRAVDNGSPVDVDKHFEVNNRNAFMGLNKVYLQATQNDGDVLFIAASILGEKHQLTSDKVSIDVEQVAIRGNPARHEISVYYTTDGSEPSKSSTMYTQPFPVAMETTVRAAVYADGQKILDMREAFTENEGLYWDKGSQLQLRAGNGHSMASRLDTRSEATFTQRLTTLFASPQATAEQKFAAWKDSRDSYADFVVQNVVDVVSAAGPREPGSVSERTAQDMILSEMSKYTDEAHKETFETHPHARMGSVVVDAFLMIGSAFLYNCGFRLWAFLLSLAAVAIFGFEFVMCKEFIDVFFPKRTSANVIGVIKPRGQVKRRAVFNGHCDSNYEWWFNYLFGPRAVSVISAGGVASMFLFFILQIVYWNEYKDWVRTTQFFCVPFYILMLFFTNWNVVVPGANSNLTGVFCAMSVAKFMKDHGIELENTEVQIVVTGCDECGLRGSKDYVKKHADGIPTAFFCFDTLRDLSGMSIYSRELAGTVRHDPGVCAVMKRAGQLAGLDLNYRTSLIKGTNAAAITQGGMHAATFSAMDFESASYYHTRNDQIDNLEPQAIRYGLDIAIGSLIVFDKEGLTQA